MAGDLWHLVVVKADLPAHLKALKDYFLLARGDFMCTFLHEVQPSALVRTSWTASRVP